MNCMEENDSVTHEGSCHTIAILTLSLLTQHTLNLQLDIPEIQMNTNVSPFVL